MKNNIKHLTVKWIFKKWKTNPHLLLVPFCLSWLKTTTWVFKKNPTFLKTNKLKAPKSRFFLRFSSWSPPDVSLHPNTHQQRVTDRAFKRLYTALFFLSDVCTCRYGNAEKRGVASREEEISDLWDSVRLSPLNFDQVKWMSLTLLHSFFNLDQRKWKELTR